MNVEAEIINSTTINISWTRLKNTNGYVVSYAKANTTFINHDSSSILLSGLSQDSVYHVAVFAYNDLLSDFTAITVVFEGELLEFFIFSLYYTFLLVAPDAVVNLSYTTEGNNTIITWNSPKNGGNISNYIITYTLCNEDERYIEEYSLTETITQHTLNDFDYSVTNNITVIASNGIGNSSTSILTNITGENMKHKYIPHNNYTYLSS